MDAAVKLCSKDNRTPMDKGRYQRLVGKLIYLSRTGLDIGSAVSVVSQFMNSQTEENKDVVFRIVRFLKMTL